MPGRAVRRVPESWLPQGRGRGTVWRAGGMHAAAGSPASALPPVIQFPAVHLPIALRRSYVDELVQAEVEGGIPSASIVVGGFSQGGAMALMSLRSKVRAARAPAGRLRWRNGAAAVTAASELAGAVWFCMKRLPRLLAASHTPALLPPPPPSATAAQAGGRDWPQLLPAAAGREADCVGWAPSSCG